MGIKKFHKDESGAIAIIVALSMILFLGMTALAVDVGYMYSVRRQLQAAADGASLAGCQTLIKGGDQAAVLTEAKLYAEQYNGVPPADGLVMLTSSPQTEVTNDYVKVTVEKNTNLFFAKLLGHSSQIIRAQAVAKRAYLSGMKSLLPWGVNIIQAKRVTAKIGSGSEVELSVNGSRWSGDLNVPSSATLGNGGYAGVPITVTAYNDQTLIWPNGVPEQVNPVGEIVVTNSNAMVANAYLNPSVVCSGNASTTSLFVESNEAPKARFNNKDYTLSLVSGNLYKVNLPVPDITNAVEYFPVNISTKTTNITNAVVLVVRRSTYPIGNITTSKTFFLAGGSNKVSIQVDLNSLTYAQKYDLKVVSGAEAGNFAALDFANIYEPPNYKNPDPSVGLAQGTNDYYYYLDHAYPGIVNIGDIIWTQTGNLSGPQTQHALLDRFAGAPNLTFEQWDALGRPSSTRVVFVPVVEKVDITTGTSPLRVNSFAAFYIEPGSDLQGDNIKGKFIEYVMPGIYTPTPPPYGIYLQTPQLTSEHLDF